MSTETIKTKEVTLLSDDELETVAGGTHHCGDYYRKEYKKDYDYPKYYDKCYDYGKNYCKY